MTRWYYDEEIQLDNERVDTADGERQNTTAREICARLEHQPGVVLADDVGMGKTFVALAVAASVVRANPGRQVVVMVPSAVADKWPNEWSVFEQHCLGGNRTIRATPQTVRRGSEFLKLLDDDAKHRKHIIFLTHGALRSNLDDPFVKLAVIRQAFAYQRSLQQQRQHFPRWAARVLQRTDFHEDRVRALMATPPATWRSVWARVAGEDRDLGDDPVPAAVISALASVELDELRDALVGVPLRASAHVDDRLRTLRRQLSQALQVVWRAAMGNVHARLPLLIFDEAHHVKNPNQLRSLFDSGDGETPDSVRGALQGVFERMLLLTATPFQLGHRELLSVLQLFDSVELSSARRLAFAEHMTSLGAALDLAQANALALDRSWTRLEPADVDSLPAHWWESDAATLPDHVARVATAIRAATATFTNAETLLQPWVIRHTKPRQRIELPGIATLPDDDGSRPGGLPIERSSVLPFLLAARAQSYIALRGLQDHRPSRALFAEGLASSFEAYVATRTTNGNHLTDDTPDALGVDSDADPHLGWYLEHIEAALPQSGADTWAQHPKVRATVARAMRHWEQGEKVLVFCFYRASGRALRRHLSLAMQRQILNAARDQLATSGQSDDEVLAALTRRADSLLRIDSRGAELLIEQIRQLARDAELEDDEAGRLSDVVLRFMRTHSFLVRYIDDLTISQTDVALERVLQAADGSGLTLGERLTSFAERVATLTHEERSDLWAALESIQTGARRVDGVGWSAGAEQHADGVLLLPNVHLANGETDRELRKRLMLTFNTPFLPEVLIASSVMAEGVDLHRECRHVIHHDLDWNPSTLEQRTGRVDRIGSKAARVGQHIVVCEPYVSGTQDEKQYVVVKDRERWFNVVMGGRVPNSEAETDRIAARVALPDELLRDLTLDLAVWRS